jgi:hypothetical protein
MQLVIASGHTVLIDEWNFPLVAQHRWRAYQFAREIWYATTKIAGKTVFMHRLIAGNPQGKEVDHKNGVGLDNRESNLRAATHQQNLANQRLSAKNTSGYRGVTHMPKGRPNRPWKAQIKHKGKCLHLGYYATREEAATVRNERFREIHGEFATTR